MPVHPPIATRWSPRAFDPDAVVTDEELTALLEAARWAATWGNVQPVRFVVGRRAGGTAQPEARGRAQRPGEIPGRAGAQRPGDIPGRVDSAFEALSGLLRRGNSYAKAAGALILLCADEGEDERTALYSAVDAGAAAANLAIEAVARGLIAHPMAGFDVEAAPEVLGLAAGLRPLIMVAVGTLGDYGEMAPEILERDSRPRERLALEDVVLNWSGTGL